MNLSRLSIATLAITSLLAACGGGGGGGGGSAVAIAPVTKVEGYYAGTVSTGSQFQLLALENDQVYALIGNTDTQGVFRVNSLVEGQGTSSNGSFSVANAKEYSSTGSVFAGSISGTFSPRATVMGTVTSPSFGTASFTGTSPVTASFNYDTAASINIVSGNWAGSTLYGGGVNFSVAATGALTGISAAGCRFTGSAAPRASGKNVLDVTVTFGPAPCELPGVTGTGIGVTSLLANGQRQLLLAVTNSSRTTGVVVFAQR
jgi:hypothetical protein